MRVLAGIGRVLRAIWWVLRYGPGYAIRWAASRVSNLIAIGWILGMASFVGLSTHRTISIKRAAIAKIEAEKAAERAREAEEKVAAELEGRPLAVKATPEEAAKALKTAGLAGMLKAGAGGRAGAAAGGTAASPAPGEVVPREQIVEFMDVDEMEKARGGSDLETREAIAGLAEEYEGEDGGVEDGGSDDPDGGAGKVVQRIEGGKPGEGVQMVMKKGGIGGWIARNKKYRKRKLGDKETLEVLFDVHGGKGTKVNVGANSPLGNLAAIAAARGSAVAEAEESGGQLEHGTATEGDLAPDDEAPAPGQPRPGSPRGAPGAAPGPAPGPRAAGPVRGSTGGTQTGPAGPGPKSTAAASVAAGSQAAPDPAALPGPAPGGTPGRGPARPQPPAAAAQAPSGAGSAPAAAPAGLAASGPTPAPPAKAPGVGISLRSIGWAVVDAMTRTPRPMVAGQQGPADASPDAELASLRKSLDPLVRDGAVSLAVRDTRVILQLPGDLLFQSAEAPSLKPTGRDVVRQVASALAAVPGRDFQVGGHMDGAPSGGDSKEESSAQKLSSARAAEVVAAMAAGGVPPARLSAMGYGSSTPIKPNDTPDHRARNRRVEIALVPRSRSGQAVAQGAPGPR